MNKNYDETQLMVFEKPVIHCKDIDLLLGDYAEEDLPESLKVRFEQHISSCESCKENADRYNEVIEVAAEIGQERRELPKSVQDNLRKALSKKLGINFSF